MISYELNLLTDGRREKPRAAIGGEYIPSSDHFIHSGISVSNYDYFISLLKKYGKYPLDMPE